MQAMVIDDFNTMPALPTVAPGGHLASTIRLGPQHFEGRDIEACAVMAVPGAGALSRPGADVAAGRLVTLSTTPAVSTTSRAHCGACRKPSWASW